VQLPFLHTDLFAIAERVGCFHVKMFLLKVAADAHDKNRRVATKEVLICLTPDKQGQGLTWIMRSKNTTIHLCLAP